MRLPFILLKSLLIWAGFAAVPVAVAKIVSGDRAAVGAFLSVGLVLLSFAVFAERSIRKALRPGLLQVGSYRVYSIEDPSSHAFLTQGLLSTEPSLWITRGALSLLSPSEIGALMSGMRAAGRQGGLRFETALTAILIGFISRIPSGFREVLFFRQKRSKTILIRESARGVFWASFVLILESFYFDRRSGVPPVAEEILRKLEAESRRCVPRLPVALSSHSAVSPWPDAFLTLGRSCLLPERAVNLET